MLDDRQELFCRHFAKTHNFRDSARRAGYSENYMNNRKALLENEGIKTRIREIEEELNGKPAILTDEQILQLLTDFALGEAEGSEYAVRLVGDGSQAIEVFTKPPTTRERLDALKQLAKLKGMEVQKVEVADTTVTVNWIGEGHNPGV